MAYCTKCGKEIENDSLFCSHCGNPVEIETDLDESSKQETEDNSLPNKSTPKSKLISKKAFLLVSIALVAIGIIIHCEIKIRNAKNLYAQAQFVEASWELKNIPALGRKALIQINAAFHAGHCYEFYLEDKRDIYSKTSSETEKAYQRCFSDLIFGLCWAKDDLENKKLNAIEQEEYQKFVNIYYEELMSTFNMPQREADILAGKVKSSDSSERSAIIDEYFESNIRFKMPSQIN